MLCNARFCKYFVRFFFSFTVSRKKKKNITVSNEFICVIKSGIQTTAGLYFMAILSHEHVPFTILNGFYSYLTLQALLA